MILFGIVSCQAGNSKVEEAPMESFRNEVTATEVRVAQAEKKSFDYLINATGKVEANSQVKVISERNGYLQEWKATEGGYVQKGAILGRLDNTDNQFRLEKAQANMRIARAKFDSDKMGFGSIYASEDTSRIRLLEEQLEASSGLLSAEIELREAEIDIEKSIIRAPISGKVADVKIKSGSLVNGGDELCEIISSDLLNLKVKVLESDIQYISQGQQADIYPVSGGPGNLKGTVQSINPKVDENGLVQVNIRLSNTGSLLPGMNARAVVRSPQSSSVVVPKQALVYRSGRPVVFTIEKNESKWNYVEVGKDNGEEVEILEGIPDKSTVIITNNLQLAHQAPVQIVKE
nr:efflux RND transporter periplasmic adaptor subunit [Pararhodonellum marinum]